MCNHDPPFQIKPKESKTCKTGAALNYVKSTVVPKTAGEEKRKQICFVITRSSSSDDISKASEQLKGAEVTLVAIGECITSDIR